MRRTRTDSIVFHHSLADQSNAETIDKWHRAKGWGCIGYHYVVLRDGTIEHGRDVHLVGAHALGRNRTSLGICLEGDFRIYEPSYAQVVSASKLYHDACRLYQKSLRIGYHRYKWLWNACPGPMLDRADFSEVLLKSSPYAQY